MSKIMNISRHRMGTDGAGITTLIGFYGCPLKCRYCINDHCHDAKIRTAEYTVEEILEVLSIDEPYYLMTGGGITFGGGEPLLHSAFIHEVCSKMNPEWKRNIETSLYAEWKQISILLQDIDYWIVDVKDVDTKIYSSYTGHDNKTVLANLDRLINQVGVQNVCVRVPRIPGYNSEGDRRRSRKYLQEHYGKDLKIDSFSYVIL